MYTQFTPGPWFMEGTKLHGDPFIHYWVRDENRLSICSMVIRDLSGQLEEANARLIAAAPDLLSACEKALKEMRDFGNIANWPFEMPYSYAVTMNLLGEIIAKAKGE